jgi:NAD-dependent SIR2 family protein deacetylase
MNIEMQLTRAAQAIRDADALLIGAGAGMGVDSGLPDFRGAEGFWRAYPLFARLGKRFEEMSNPAWFRSDPELAWGFFGHRLNLYKAASPHAGFEILRRFGEERRHGYFVFTSNVDGHFQKAGFDADRIVECHGSIHYLQCVDRCGEEIWPADELAVVVDEQTIRAAPPLPCCRRCGGLARPNILMFGDWDWRSQRSDEQALRYEEWNGRQRDSKLAVIELGAGLAVPTVRYECQRRAGRLIRINPRDSRVPDGQISLPLGALDALRRIDEQMGRRD